MSIDSTKTSTIGGTISITSIEDAAVPGSVMIYFEREGKKYRVSGVFETDANLDEGYYNSITVYYDIEPNSIVEVS